MPYRNHYDPNQPRVPEGHHEGGRWTRDGLEQHPTIQRAFYDPRRLVVQKGIEGLLALFTWLSTRNDPNQQAIIEFKARQFHVNGETKLDAVNIDELTREEVNQACRKLVEVQEKTNEAVMMARSKPEARYWTPARFGTDVHLELKYLIQKENDPKLKPEVSYIKSKGEADYGEKGSIRIDVLENAGNKTVCVYDIKTGRSGLTVPRMIEIASNAIRAFPGTERIIVTEVRPTRW